ncbi:MAG: DUF2170 family protein [Gammaproteobacteria bacterium]|jgi:uncharacterized protein|nr:DUF2170 family protein [Gammaproteobacteria bacterium]
MNERLTEVVEALNGATTVEGLVMAAEIIDREEQMAKVTVESREELPMILDINDDQILVMTNLWGAEEVKKGVEAEMMSTMLSMNIPLPLSSFAKTGSQYQLFGALSVESRDEVIVQEVELLSSNAEAVLDTFSVYLDEL